MQNSPRMSVLSCQRKIIWKEHECLPFPHIPTENFNASNRALLMVTDVCTGIQNAPYVCQKLLKPIKNATNIKSHPTKSYLPSRNQSKQDTVGLLGCTFVPLSFVSTDTEWKSVTYDKTTDDRNKRHRNTRSSLHYSVVRLQKKKSTDHYTRTLLTLRSCLDYVLVRPISMFKWLLCI